MKRKGAAEVLSFVAIALVTMGLVGTALMWGMPLITERQDMVKLDRICNYFNKESSNSLVQKIEFVAKNGGKETIAIDTSGIWILHPYDEIGLKNNSVEYVTFSKVDKPTYSVGWVPADDLKSRSAGISDYYRNEAERLGLIGGYVNSANCICSSPSGGRCARHQGALPNEGRVRISSFPNSTGLYNIKFRFCDENDDPAGQEDSYRIYVNGQLVDSTSSIALGPSVWKEFSSVKNVNNGDEVAVGCTRGSGATYCRIDWIEASGIGLSKECPPPSGLIGIDSPIVACARSELFKTGFNVTHRAWSRELVDQSGERGYKINLIQDPSGQLTSTEGQVSISRERIYTCTPPDSECPDKTLIITEIKILLV